MIIYGSYAMHVVCLVTVIGLTVVYPSPMTGSIIVGGLVGTASLTTVKHRVASLFIAFGLTLAPAFWMAVAEINARQFLGLIPPVLLITGVAWSLQKPNWIAGAFTSIAVALMLLLARLAYVHRFEADYSTPERVARSSIIVSALISLALVQTLLGIAIKQTTPKKRKSRKTDTIPTPVE